MAMFVVELDQHVELGVPGASVGVPHETNRVKFLNLPVQNHCWVTLRPKLEMVPKEGEKTQQRCVGY